MSLLCEPSSCARRVSRCTAQNDRGVHLVAHPAACDSACDKYPLFFLEVVAAVVQQIADRAFDVREVDFQFIWDCDGRHCGPHSHPWRSAECEGPFRGDTEVMREPAQLVHSVNRQVCRW